MGESGRSRLFSHIASLLPGRKKRGLFFIVDPETVHGGLTDQLKAIVGLYYIARENRVAFHMIHRGYGDIREFLVPNRVDWSCELSDLDQDPRRTEEFIYRYPWTELPVLESRRIQYQCRKYYPRNILQSLDVPQWNAVWHGLFHDLFRPSPYLQSLIDGDRGNLPERYNAVHVRFIDSLGYAEKEKYNRVLPPPDRDRLIREVTGTIRRLKDMSDLPFLVFSDSGLFLDSLGAEEGLIPMSSAHVANLAFTDDNGARPRTYLDLYRMSRAGTVWSVTGVEGFARDTLYESLFPLYTSVIGGGSFTRVRNDIPQRIF